MAALQPSETVCLKTYLFETFSFESLFFGVRSGQHAPHRSSFVDKQKLIRHGPRPYEFIP